jgi:hypothetical protein
VKEKDIQESEKQSHVQLQEQRQGRDGSTMEESDEHVSTGAATTGCGDAGGEESVVMQGTIKHTVDSDSDSDDSSGNRDDSKGKGDGMVDIDIDTQISAARIALRQMSVLRLAAIHQVSSETQDYSCLPDGFSLESNGDCDGMEDGNDGEVGVTSTTTATTVVSAMDTIREDSGDCDASAACCWLLGRGKKRRLRGDDLDSNLVISKSAGRWVLKRVALASEAPAVVIGR